MSDLGRALRPAPVAPAGRPGPVPPTPLVAERTRRSGVRAVVGQLWHRVFDDRVLGMSAEAGFWGLVSLPSLLLGILGTVGYLGGVLGHHDIVQIHDQVLQVAGDVLPPQTVSSDIGPLINEILGRGHAELLSISFVISLWSGSTAMSSYLNTITVAYGMRGRRSALRSRAVSLGLYLLAVLTGIVLLPALVLGPDELTDLVPASAQGVVSSGIDAAYWPGLVVISIVVLATLYRLCLPVRVRWRRHLPGAVLATLIWLGGSLGVRIYATTKLRNASYGALAAPLAALLFFYFIALAVLLGAELNAVLRGEPDVPVVGAPMAGVHAPDPR